MWVGSVGEQLATWSARTTSWKTGLTLYCASGNSLERRVLQPFSCANWSLPGASAIERDTSGSGMLVLDSEAVLTPDEEHVTVEPGVKKWALGLFEPGHAEIALSSATSTVALILNRDKLDSYHPNAFNINAQIEIHFDYNHEHSPYYPRLALIPEAS